MKTEQWNETETFQVMKNVSLKVIFCPSPQERKTSSKSKEDVMMDEAMSIL